MKRNHWKQYAAGVLAAVLTFAGILGAGSMAQAESEEKQIQILFTHDIHS